MNDAPVLSMDTVLARTEEGTRQMIGRDPALGPKLWAALSLVTGRQTVGDLLALAGGLAHVLEEQLRTLVEMELVIAVTREPRCRVPSAVRVSTVSLDKAGVLIRSGGTSR